jgi:hypothetical protein
LTQKKIDSREKEAVFPPFFAHHESVFICEICGSLFFGPLWDSLLVAISCSEVWLFWTAGIVDRSGFLSHGISERAVNHHRTPKKPEQSV